MTDEPENLVLACLRRIDQRLERVEDRLESIESRMTSMELNQATAMRQRGSSAETDARLQASFGQFRGELDRVNRRLGIADGQPWPPSLVQG